MANMPITLPFGNDVTYTEIYRVTVIPNASQVIEMPSVSLYEKYDGLICIIENNITQVTNNGTYANFKINIFVDNNTFMSINVNENETRTFEPHRVIKTALFPYKNYATSSSNNYNLYTIFKTGGSYIDNTIISFLARCDYNASFVVTGNALLKLYGFTFNL